MVGAVGQLGDYAHSSPSKVRRCTEPSTSRAVATSSSSCSTSTYSCTPTSKHQMSAHANIGRGGVHKRRGTITHQHCSVHEGVEGSTDCGSVRRRGGGGCPHNTSIPGISNMASENCFSLRHSLPPESRSQSLCTTQQDRPIHEPHTLP